MRHQRTVGGVVLVVVVSLAAVGVVLALVDLAIWVVPPALVEAELPKSAKIPDADRLKAINDVRGALLTALGVLAVFSGTVVAYLNSRRTLELNRRGQVTDRFGKAIDQLGKSDQVDVRIGGIYALEQIAWDSPELRWPIVEALTAFIRELAKPAVEAEPTREQSGPSQGVTADIQAALTVLGRRTSRGEPRRLFLFGLDLRGADLLEANLKNADLTGGRTSATCGSAGPTFRERCSAGPTCGAPCSSLPTSAARSSMVPTSPRPTYAKPSSTTPRPRA